MKINKGKSVFKYLADKKGNSIFNRQKENSFLVFKISFHGE